MGLEDIKMILKNFNTLIHSIFNPTFKNTLRALGLFKKSTNADINLKKIKELNIFASLY